MNFYFDLVKTFFKKYFGKALLVIMIVSILILNIYHIFFQDLKLNNSCTNNINEKIIERKNYRNGEIYQKPILPDVKQYTKK